MEINYKKIIMEDFMSIVQVKRRIQKLKVEQEEALIFVCLMMLIHIMVF